jgi:hypothetical protein
MKDYELSSRIRAGTETEGMAKTYMCRTLYQGRECVNGHCDDALIYLGPCGAELLHRWQVQVDNDGRPSKDNGEHLVWPSEVREREEA